MYKDIKQIRKYNKKTINFGELTLHTHTHTRYTDSIKRLLQQIIYVII